MKKAFSNLLGMILTGLGAFGLTFFVNEFIWEYSNLLDAALVAAISAMIFFTLVTLFGKKE